MVIIVETSQAALDQERTPAVVAVVVVETLTDARAVQEDLHQFRDLLLLEQVAEVAEATSAERRVHGPQHRAGIQAALVEAPHRMHSLDPTAAANQEPTAEALAVVVATTRAVEHQTVEQAVQES
jgi:hypothetical protein